MMYCTSERSQMQEMMKPVTTVRELIILILTRHFRRMLLPFDSLLDSLSYFEVD